ncbi:hypothetical protein CRP01_23450 [Flavilitoribacter nigricans DSM 23189 = NBRC 102662]|uniref:Adhesin domain-containing protein n=2 Tax=Flavilitoribacter TaxID=2762562 RepID=A0A2D0N6N8_FLAN2|nr:hypothetical protein CRP01_23450 [Flavilitoribacter nigricans DSM 23189 = NBRC 102662]
MIITPTLKGGLLLLAVAVMSLTPLFGQGNPIKTIEESYAAKANVRISHRYGPLKVVPATNGKVGVSVKLFGEASDQEDLETLKRYFKCELTESSNDLEVVTHLKVRNWNNRNGVTRLELEDGTRINNLRNLKIEATVSVPASSKLFVSNKYDEILIESGVKNNLAIDIYSGRINVGNVGGSLALKAKYSKGKLGNFEDADLEIYDSDLEMGNGRNVMLKSKYSELIMGSFNDLTADTYDDDIKWGTIIGELNLQDKYTEFSVGRFNNARIDIYDGEFISDGGNELLVKSKYTEFKIKEVGQLSFESSYDDKVEIGRLGSLSADSKYTEFKIEKLRNKLFLKSYDDELEVDELTGPLEGIEFEGKYTDFSIKLPEGSEFQMDANLTYGRLNYPEERLESQFYKEKNDRLEFRGKTKGATDSSPKITIISYDGKITIDD